MIWPTTPPERMPTKLNFFLFRAHLLFAGSMCPARCVRDVGVSFDLAIFDLPPKLQVKNRLIKVVYNGTSKLCTQLHPRDGPPESAAAMKQRIEEDIVKHEHERVCCSLPRATSSHVLRTLTRMPRARSALACPHTCVPHLHVCLHTHPSHTRRVRRALHRLKLEPRPSSLPGLRRARKARAATRRRQPRPLANARSAAARATSASHHPSRRR